MDAISARVSIPEALIRPLEPLSSPLETARSSAGRDQSSGISAKPGDSAADAAPNIPDSMLSATISAKTRFFNMNFHLPLIDPYRKRLARPWLLKQTP